MIIYISLLIVYDFNNKLRLYIWYQSILHKVVVNVILHFFDLFFYEFDSIIYLYIYIHFTTLHHSTSNFEQSLWYQKILFKSYKSSISIFPICIFKIRNKCIYLSLILQDVWHIDHIAWHKSEHYDYNLYHTISNVFMHLTYQWHHWLTLYWTLISNNTQFGLISKSFSCFYVIFLLFISKTTTTTATFCKYIKVISICQMCIFFYKLKAEVTISYWFIFLLHFNLPHATIQTVNSIIYIIMTKKIY